MKTCGDLDGKPCEWNGQGACPMGPDPSDVCPACVPVLALLEARAEAAKWKRAAERLASRLPMHHDQCAQIVPCLGPDMPCDECQLAWALKEVP
jgi:hypothetical protein